MQTFSVFSKMFQWQGAGKTDQKLQNPSPQKRIAIKLQSELFMVLSLLFFIVILVKKKEEKKEEDSYTIRTMLY